MKRINYYPLLYKDNYYHVYNRGNGNERIFFNEKNHSFFLEQFRNYLNDLVDLYAFCLLPNHFHMLIKVNSDTPEEVSKHFRNFFISYSMSINVQQKRKGNLFQRGFKRKLIDSEKYLMKAVYYIHNNPIHHNICNLLDTYPYSSYKLITSGNKFVKGSEVLIWFNGVDNFIEFHKKELPGINNENFVIEEH